MKYKTLKQCINWKINVCLPILYFCRKCHFLKKMGICFTYLLKKRTKFSIKLCLGNKSSIFYEISETHFLFSLPLKNCFSEIYNPRENFYRAFILFFIYLIERFIHCQILSFVASISLLISGTEPEKLARVWCSQTKSFRQQKCVDGDPLIYFSHKENVCLRDTQISFWLRMRVT